MCYLQEVCRSKSSLKGYWTVRCAGADRHTCCQAWLDAHCIRLGPRYNHDHCAMFVITARWAKNQDLWDVKVWRLVIGYRTFKAEQCFLLQGQPEAQEEDEVECMWGCYDKCICVLVICVFVFTVFYIVFTVFLYYFFFVYLFLFVLYVQL